MPLISVILPIYNAAFYLEQCLESIRVQTFSDIEILCVNDGSTDTSLAIIQKFAKQDTRFKVLDKPNGGYGHSLNYGLDRATGEYISIIEPDDFIAPTMYEDLYGFARSGQELADVVKGSYWEYFDARADFDEQLREPNIALCMKDYPIRFRLEQDTEIFIHHPSIWSAIYRKVFLDENNIRFVEPKGAAWADNPFFVKTLVCADSIIWVPRPYYYYRQTNEAASSFLKDYRVPFDRMREMRAILHDQNASSNIEGTFYVREFDYIFSVIGEFGFDEGDEKVHELIAETLSSMDAGIVHTNTMLRPKDIRYYDDFMGLGHAIGADETIAQASTLERREVLLSIIVLLQDHAEYVESALQALRETGLSDYEVLAVNCGSTDRSPLVIAKLGETDEHIRLLPGKFGSVAEGANFAQNHMMGRFVFFLDASWRLSGNIFARAVASLADSSVDAMLLDETGVMAVDAMHAGKSYLTEDFVAGADHDEGLVGKPFAPVAAPDVLFNCGKPGMYSVIYRLGFLRDNGFAIAQDEVLGDGALRMRALPYAKQISYASLPEISSFDYGLRKILPFYPDLHEESIAKPLCVYPALKRAYDESPDEIQDRYRVSFANALVDAFVFDVTRYPTSESMQRFVDRELSGLRDLVDQVPGRLMYVKSYYAYQLIARLGLSAFLVDARIKVDQKRRYYKQERDYLWNSPTLRLGKKMNMIARKLFPAKLIGIIKSDSASLSKTEKK